MKDYVVVVDWVPLLDALPVFRAWLSDHGREESDVDASAVQVDTARGTDGDLRRVLVARQELDRLAIDPPDMSC